MHEAVSEISSMNVESKLRFIGLLADRDMTVDQGDED